jgi:pentose-5-phosphate-3-epimerase
LGVFQDIRAIRSWCDLPIDLHIITNQPSKYFDLLRENPVEYITFQFEDLNNKLEIPDDIGGKKGLAIVTPTDISVFDTYAHFDFILIMATTPGQSGGTFDRINFSKIRQFRKKYPNKSIHVDGGVNAEVSFILRNMGVSSSVSGSYLFNAPSIGHALMNLTKREIDSHYKVADFMMPIAECPTIDSSNSPLDLKTILETIENGNVGFCLVVGEKNQFKGIVSSADIRKWLLKNIDNIGNANPYEMVNPNPVSISSNQTVVEMLTRIKKCDFPVMYLPVVNENNEAVGIVNFVHLIKGEL